MKVHHGDEPTEGEMAKGTASHTMSTLLAGIAAQTSLVVREIIAHPIPECTLPGYVNAIKAQRGVCKDEADG